MTTLDELASLNRVGLAAVWSDLLGGDVPPRMSQPMQRRFLAFALQASQRGGVPPAVLARLDRIAAGDARTAAPTLRPGARLLRAWNGTTHVVDVLPDGFMWDGARHRSLSAIARAITGARWSGPRFFGLSAQTEPDAAWGTASQPQKRRHPVPVNTKPSMRTGEGHEPRCQTAMRRPDEEYAA